VTRAPRTSQRSTAGRGLSKPCPNQQLAPAAYRGNPGSTTPATIQGVECASVRLNLCSSDSASSKVPLEGIARG
jgi:hypothetical protein